MNQFHSGTTEPNVLQHVRTAGPARISGHDTEKQDINKNRQDSGSHVTATMRGQTSILKLKVKSLQMIRQIGRLLMLPVSSRFLFSSFLDPVPTEFQISSKTKRSEFSLHMRTELVLCQLKSTLSGHSLLVHHVCLQLFCIIY